MSAEKFGLWQILPVASKDISNQANERGKFLGGKIKSDQEVRFLNTRYFIFNAGFQLTSASERFPRAETNFNTGSQSKKQSNKIQYSKSQAFLQTTPL